MEARVFFNVGKNGWVGLEHVLNMSDEVFKTGTVGHIPRLEVGHNNLVLIEKITFSFDHRRG